MYLFSCGILSTFNNVCNQEGLEELLIYFDTTYVSGSFGRVQSTLMMRLLPLSCDPSLHNIHLHCRTHPCSHWMNALEPRTFAGPGIWGLNTSLIETVLPYGPPLTVSARQCIGNDCDLTGLRWPTSKEACEAREASSELVSRFRSEQYGSIWFSWGYRWHKMIQVKITMNNISFWNVNEC